MKIPIITGVIERRILANFHADPEVVARILPKPFRPQLVNGLAIAGICLIRLQGIRPRFLPIPLGLSSENAAHRIAVEWDDGGQRRQGVYIPRRDTSSRLNTWAGGTLFPGVHHLAAFEVNDQNDQISVDVRSNDGTMRIHVSGSLGRELPDSTVFQNLSEASQFFANGSLGYSATREQGRYDGLELSCKNWHVDPLNITEVESSFFDDRSRFPAGTISFDCALLMRNIRHEWHGKKDLCCHDAIEAVQI